MLQAIAPGVWADRGPQAATTTKRNYAVVPALPVGDMLPMVAGTPLSTEHKAAVTAGLLRYNADKPRPEPQEAPRALRRQARIRGELDPQPKPRCGVLLKVIGEPCARRPGHKYDHQSAAYVARWNAVRRAAPRWKPQEERA